MRVSPSNYTEPLNKGEERVRSELEKSFPKSSYIALHSVGLSRHAKKPYGEADFVVITDFGIFCLEVKGGNVVRRQDGKWEIGYKESGNYYISSEGPFKQAAGANAVIYNELRAKDPERMKKFLVFWGVVFPNTYFNETDTEWELAQVCDFAKINDFEKYLSSLSEFAKQTFQKKGIQISEETITREDIEWVAKNLRKDIEITGTKKTLLISSKNDLIQKDEDQKVILDEYIYGDKHRLILTGGPGTGKTLLCQTAARHSSENNNKTLLLCFNRPLANQLALSLSDCRNVTVQTVHSFMIEFCDNMNVTLNRSNTSDYEFFNNLLPNCFEEAVYNALDDEKYFFDTLIIDEGQDFLGEHLLSLIFNLLKGGFENGNWLISLDQNIQAEIYSKFDPDTFQKLIRNGNCDQRQLFRNFRNPKAVGEKANSLYPEIKLPIPSRKFNSYVKLWTYSNTSEAKQILLLKIQNLMDEGVEASQITILTCEPYKKSFLRDLTNINSTRLKHLGYSDLPEPKTIYWSNVQAFKGLENEFVFLVGLTSNNINDAERAKIFLALTRTLTEVHIICEKNSPALEL